MMLLDKARAAADQAELYTLRRKTIHVRFAENTLDRVAHRNTSACALRVISHGKLGASVAESPSQQLLDDARETASFGQTAAFSFASPQAYPDAAGFNPDVETLAAGDLIDRVIDVKDRIVRAVPKASAHLICEAESGERILETTEGAQAREPFSRVALGVRLPFPSKSGDGGAGERLISTGLVDVTEDWLERLLEMREWGATASVPTSGRLPVLLTPYVSNLLTLTLAACLGSESVAAGASPFAAQVGEQILSERLTIREDPTATGSPFRRSFDDEGVAVHPRAIVERGILNGFLTDLRGAADLGQAPTGNASRRTLFSEKIEDAPMPTWLGAVIEPGEHSWRKLLGGMEEGILVTRMSGLHSSNLLQGQYAIHVDGFHVRGGKPIGHLERTMLAGNVFEDFAHIRAVSREQQPTAQAEMEVAGLAPHILLDAAQVTVG